VRGGVMVALREEMNWSMLSKRTNDPKLAYLEYLLESEGIPTRREGESWHAPILEVPKCDLDRAWSLLGPLDDIEDDDPQFEDGPRLRDEQRDDCTDRRESEKMRWPL
jgi:hypothetical protein